MRRPAHRLRFTDPFFGVRRGGATDAFPMQVSRRRVRVTRGVASQVAWPGPRPAGA